MIADYEAEIKEKLEDGDSIKSIYMSLLNRTSFDSLKSYSNFKQYVNRWYFDSKVEGKHLVPKKIQFSLELQALKKHILLQQ